MKHNEIAGESGGSVRTLPAGKTSIFSLSRVALKERNRVVSERDSPVKRPGRKATRVLGSEGDGLKDSIIESCDYTVLIPMSHGVDSLNVAAAAAVAFWELRIR